MTAASAYSCSSPPCPMASSALPEAAATAMDLKCPVCGSKLVASEKSPPAAVPSAPAFPEGLTPDTMPTYLAHAWSALWTEAHPRIRLYWLVDTAELVVRWTVAVALAEVVHGHDGGIPEDIADSLRDHIERPTLGRWLGILRSLSQARPAAPLLAPGVFDLYSAHFEPLFQSEKEGGTGGTIETSLLVLRNQVAHGGGMSTSLSQELLDEHLPALSELLRAVLGTMAGAEIIALHDGAARLLQGTQPQNCTIPPVLVGHEDGPWLVSPAGALPLLPLASFGPVRMVDQRGALEVRPGGPTAQVYARGSKDRLSFTPLGRDEACSEDLDVADFRALFHLDADRPATKSLVTIGGFAWDDFLREARVLAEDLIGRADDLKVIKAWLKSRQPRDEGAARLGWVSGGPGIGKSMVIARLVSDYGNSPARLKGLFYHRFRGGDARNNRRSMLRLLQAALWAWEPLAARTEAPAEDDSDGQALEEDVKGRLAAVATLESPAPQSPAPSFWVFLDGLDEVVGSDTGLPALLKQMAVPGTVWLLAGRPEHGLDETLRTPGCEALFEHGLPPMSAGDIRAMLLEGLGNARYGLLERDEDEGETVRNTFVDRVVERAKGLPLYVHLLLEDLRSGQLTVRDDENLPNGLTAYYDALTDRIGLGFVTADLTMIVCLLARAEEPLDEAGLAVLLARGPRRAERYLPQVRAALRAGSALLRRAPSPDTDEAWMLYHQSFREYVAGRAASEGHDGSAPAPALEPTLRSAEDLLADTAAAWAELSDSMHHALRAHLFRWGTEYALWWHGKEGVAAASGRLTDFSYLQARTATLPAREITDLVHEYAVVLAELPSGADRERFRLWEAFFREHAHILRRGNEHWPTNKILLQLAVEHADDSPVTRAAETWLEADHCDWFWLRRAGRPARAMPSMCLLTLEGHTGGVRGALALPDGRLLSWSDENTLRIWDGASGAGLASLDGHTNEVFGALALPDGRVVSWSMDHSLRIWSAATGACVVHLKGHTEPVYGAMELPGGRLLSWSYDNLRLWAAESGACLASLDGHTNEVFGALALLEGKLLSWSGDNTLRIWDGDSGACLSTLEGHTASVRGALVLPGGRLLSWSDDSTLRVWDGENGVCLASVEGHTREVDGALVLQDGRLLSWSRDGTLRIWDGDSGACLATLEGHASAVAGALALPNGRLLSWSWDDTPRIWDGESGACLATLDGHTGTVDGVLVLPEGRLLSWSMDCTLRIWDGEGGACLATLDGHNDDITGALALPDGRLLSWSNDRTLRIWDSRSARPSNLEGHANKIQGALVLPDGRLLSWSLDDTLRVWDRGSGACLATLEGHTSSVAGALVLPDGRLLSWSLDDTLRVWDRGNGACLATLEGHTSSVAGALALSDGRLLSWSFDNTLRIWDGERGVCLATLEGHTSAVAGALALPDGRLLSWSSDNALRIWDDQGSACLATLRGHTGPVLGALTFPDGRLASWSLDKTLRTWDGETGECLATLEGGHTSAVTGALVLPDGRLLSWSWLDIRTWDGESDACPATLEGHPRGISGALALPDGRLLSWSDNDRTLRVWDGLSGNALSCWAENVAFHEAPELWAKYAEGRAGCAASPLTAGPVGSGVGAVLADRALALWQGDGMWTVDALKNNGTIAAHCDRHLAVLHLYFGHRHVNVDEAVRQLRISIGASEME